MNPNAPADVPLLALLAVAFLALWATAMPVISMLAGWTKLARRYRRRASITGTTWWLQSAGVQRYVQFNYGSCLTVTANDDGIGLAVLFPFRIGHPPIFIPWSEILVTQVQRFMLLHRVRLSFPEEPSVKIEISDRLADKIQAAIGQNWFNEVDSRRSPQRGNA